MKSTVLAMVSVSSHTGLGGERRGEEGQGEGGETVSRASLIKGSRGFGCQTRPPFQGNAAMTLPRTWLRMLAAFMGGVPADETRTLLTIEAWISRLID
jgi:hypothetical protein